MSKCPNYSDMSKCLIVLTCPNYSDMSNCLIVLTCPNYSDMSKCLIVLTCPNYSDTSKCLIVLTCLNYSDTSKCLIVLTCLNYSDVSKCPIVLTCLNYSDIDNKSIGRPGSSVWNHFTKGEGKSKGKHTATCLFCNKYYPRGTPNELESHLATRCIQVPSSLKEHYLRVISNKDCDSNKYLNHDKIRELMLFAIELWADMGHGKQTSTRLVSQIHLYREKKPPYDLPYDNAISSYTWWNLLSKSGAEKLLENEDNEEIEIGNDENNEEIEVDDVESNEDAAINNQTRLLIEDYINIDINLFNSEINIISGMRDLQHQIRRKQNASLKQPTLEIFFHNSNE
ncbi:16709_t:CDS:2 [Entrophospora sp. SA101]|nr:16709_t:CDS:2 [Entrophospora sp. SA101]